MITALDGKFSTTHVLDQLSATLNVSGIESGAGKAASCGGLRAAGFKKVPYSIIGGVCHLEGRLAQPHMQVNLTDGNYPVITIVTVVYNGASVLEETIDSVLKQNYPNVEYIIVDGGSTDGSIDIIRRHESAIDYWISEKDGGIYDAMNKAVGLATGSWINFMNAGDLLASAASLSAIAGVLDDDRIGLVYGNHYVNFGDGLTLPSVSRATPRGLLMPFSHQAGLYRRTVLAQYPFNQSYRLAADYDQLHRLLAAQVAYKRVDTFIATIETGGVSDTRRLQVMKEYCRITGFHPMYLVYVARLFVKAVMVLAVPRSLFARMEQNARRKRFHD